MDSVDLRLSIQLINLALAIIVAVIIYKASGRGEICPRLYCGIFILSIHIAVYYTFVCLWSCGIFSITDFLNGLFGVDFIKFSLWSAAIRLQTLIEMLLMALTVRRRTQWIKSLK